MPKSGKVNPATAPVMKPGFASAQNYRRLLLEAPFARVGA
jgi:hypothetical protein